MNTSETPLGKITPESPPEENSTQEKDKAAEEKQAEELTSNYHKTSMIGENITRNIMVATAWLGTGFVYVCVLLMVLLLGCYAWNIAQDTTKLEIFFINVWDTISKAAIGANVALVLYFLQRRGKD